MRTQENIFSWSDVLFYDQLFSAPLIYYIALNFSMYFFMIIFYRKIH